MGDTSIKQILINPDLFNINNRKYKNKTPKKEGNSSNGHQNSTVSRTPKGRILKHIQKIYNQEKKSKKKNILNNLFNNSEENKFNNELDSSIDYLLNISNNNDNATPMPVLATPMPVLATPMPVMEHVNTPIIVAPKYGCLKNGTLPTYNNYSKMLKNPRSTSSNEKQNGIVVKPIININNHPPFTNQPSGLQMFLNNVPSNSQYNSQSNGKSNGKSNGQSNMPSNVPIVKGVGLKKMIRRTFKLGKSRKDSKVGVLISNRTIRNQISNKMKEIYQIPISDIKKFLVKKGLIKVGSTAPNDILREMYKNVIMLCSDLQNHNTQNLLYNYLNNKNE